jgi:Arc/MetJ-type ribon-helix-helix transcriptional regulator
MGLEELIREALQLNKEARAVLARELLVSLEGRSDAEHEQLWIDEAIHRDQELDQGTAKAFTVEEVFHRLERHRQ